MWIARDNYNQLWLFARQYKPIQHKSNKSDYIWWECPKKDIDNFLLEEGYELPESLFPEVTFENSPVEVDIFRLDKLGERISKIVTEFNDNYHPKPDYMIELIKKETWEDGEEV